MEDNQRQDEWIVTLGFPCQDISIAGSGEGITGTRSGLWFEAFEVIRILRPKFAIIENVGAITFRGLDRVLADLASIRYDASWQDIPAKAIMSPQLRRRLWIVAYPSEFRCDEDTIQKEIMFESNHEKWGYLSTIFVETLGRSYPEIPKYLRVDDGIPIKLDRIKALGNSIVPQIAELLFRQIKKLIDD